MTDEIPIQQLRERLVERATLGRQRAEKLLKDPDFDASRQAAEEFIDALHDYFVAIVDEQLKTLVNHRHVITPPGGFTDGPVNW